jgi:hypothetical protein
VRAVLRRHRRTGTSIVAGAEADRSHAAGVHVTHPPGFLSWGAGAALFWLLGGQAEEGARKDELACPARGQTEVGGQRMTEAAAEASDSGSVSGARAGDALAGGSPVSAVLRSGA